MQEHELNFIPGLLTTNRLVDIVLPGLEGLDFRVGAGISSKSCPEMKKLCQDFTTDVV